MEPAQEKLEILTMISEGKITPEQGVRLIGALEKSAGGAQTSFMAAEAVRNAAAGPKWLNIEVRAKSGGEYVSVTPIRIPFSLIRLFLRFIPKESSIPGSASTLDEALEDLRTGKPLELYTEEGQNGRAIRISAE